MYRPTALATGVSSRRPYDLRHSFASLLVHDGRLKQEGWESFLSADGWFLRDLDGAPSVLADSNEYAVCLDVTRVRQPGAHTLTSRAILVQVPTNVRRRGIVPEVSAYPTLSGNHMRATAMVPITARSVSMSFEGSEFRVRLHSV